MRVTIHPSELYGTIQAPASKSYAQRALAAALLANGFTVLRNPSRCDDAVSAMKVIQALGADISDHGDQLKIRGGFSPVSTNLNFGEAGLGIRLFASIAALHTGEITLSGSGSLTKRPMGLIHEALSTLGVNCKTNNGFLPIKVNGPLNGGNIKIDGSLSSQVLTGLLMALPLAKNDSVIEVHNLQSIPYIDMTLQLMKDFGIIVSHNNYQEFCIPGQQRYIATDYLIEGDWSGGA
ncbi:MAG: 3-phosphoshikimate 1-carboxyvinyltransferase, partial [Bacteroidetes bacterium]|nr:3-phosphoshikimate 1-carboxyvinyltransferase [Bacteroidota bacterium]